MVCCKMEQYIHTHSCCIGTMEQSETNRCALVCSMRLYAALAVLCSFKQQVPLFSLVQTNIHVFNLNNFRRFLLKSNQIFGGPFLETTIKPSFIIIKRNFEDKQGTANFHLNFTTITCKYILRRVHIFRSESFVR